MLYRKIISIYILVTLLSSLEIKCSEKSEFTTGKHENLRKTIDDLEDHDSLKRWNIRGGNEAHISHVKKINSFSLNWSINIDHKEGADPKYPAGWLFLERIFVSPQDWSFYKTLEFCLETPPGQKSKKANRILRFGIKFSDREPEWHNIRPGKTRQKISLDLCDYLISGKLKHVAGLCFYVAENWYEDGDKLNFYLDDFYLVRGKAGVDLSLAFLTKIDYGLKDKSIKVTIPVFGSRKSSHTSFCAYIKAYYSPLKETKISSLKAEQKENSIILDIPLPELQGNLYTLKIEDENNSNSSPELIFRKNSKTVPMLHLFTFKTKSIGDSAFTEQLEKINMTPYDSVSVWLTNACCGDSHSWEKIRPIVENIKGKCHKDLWPTIFFNRFIERASDIKNTHHRLENEEEMDYFKRFKGMDIDDKGGNLEDFYNDLSIALKTAKVLGSTGITIDPEAYNNYPMMFLEKLAERRGEAPEVIKKKLFNIGCEMAKIINDIYPNIQILALFIKREQATAIIFEGLLDYSKGHNIPLKLIEGGETSLNYTNDSIDGLKKKIRDRVRFSFEDWLKKYPDHFILGATIAPTDTPDKRRGWIKTAYQNAGIEKLEDLEPYMETLITTYPFLWIYAASATEFNPYSTEAVRYHSMLQKWINKFKNKK